MKGLIFIRYMIKNIIVKAKILLSNRVNAPMSPDMKDIKILSFKLSTSISPEYLNAVSIPVINPTSSRVKNIK